MKATCPALSCCRTLGVFFVFNRDREDEEGMQRLDEMEEGRDEIDSARGNSPARFVLLLLVPTFDGGICE